jgi:hypothetical protein
MKLYFFILILICSCSSVEEGSCIPGSIKSGYKQVMANGKAACETASQTCLEGKWDGPQVFESCEL